MRGDIVIAVSRSLAGLEAIVSRRNVECEIVSVPLSEIASDLRTEAKSVLASWAALADADLTDEKTLGHVLNILEKTIPVDEHIEPLKPIESMISEKRSPIATAANPRAFKGTKRKLPKQRCGVTKLDLRPYLMSQRSINEVLDQFAFRSAAKDPYLATNHSDSQISSVYELQEQFRRFVLPAMKGSPWRTVAVFLRLFWELDLANDRSLLANACRYLKLRGPEDALAAMSDITRLPPEVRADLLKILIEFEESGVTVPAIETGWLLRIVNRGMSEKVLENVRFALQCRTQKISFEYTEIAMDLFEEFHPVMPAWRNELRVDGDMSEPRLAADKFPVKELRECLRRQLDLEPGDEMFLEKPWWGLGLLFWKQFARRPELAEVFRTIPWNRLHPAVAQAYALLILHSANVFGIDDEENERRIEILLAHHRRITEFLLRVDEPKHQKSFLCDIDRMPDAMKELLPVIFPKFLDLLERVSRPPFSPDSYVSTLLYTLLARLPNEYHDKILQLTDSELARLSRSCFRHTETSLIACGVAELSAWEPKLVTGALISFHGKLLKVGKLLGSTNRKLRTEILLEFKEHALSRLELPFVSSEGSLDRVNLILSSGCAEQIPRKLRRYVSGDIDLTDAQLAKSIAVAESKLDLVKLDLLERLCYSRLAPGDNGRKMDGSVRHALQMVQCNTRDMNVRAFRKFLFRYLDGEIDYLLRHPRNASWLKSRNQLNLQPWLEGFERHYCTGEGRDAITLRIETNPLEELKFGSHVGSCTGLGGGYSAAALGTVLDINKRVVYASNTKGKIVGRQLIALTSDNQLFCQEIYPRSALLRWRSQFDDFDRSLAREVGIEIYMGNSSSGEMVENLVAMETYDDHRIDEQHFRRDGGTGKSWHWNSYLHI